MEPLPTHMRIAVTGATGFIGGYVVRGLAREGHALRALCRPGREDSVPRPEGAEVEVHVGDLTDGASLHGLCEGCDMLLHVASAHDHLGDEAMRAVNVKGTENLVAEARRANPRIQFWVVSSAVIGAPVYSYYRDSKRIQEKIIKGSGLEWASFRPTLVYGVGDWRHTAPLFRKCARQRGSYWIPHSGRSKINPVHVEDVVDAITKYFRFDRGVDCMYELAGPGGIPFNDFVDLTIEATGGQVRRRNLPKKLVDKIIFVKGLFTDVTADRRASAYFTLHHEHDISNAVHELDWHPRPYAEGVRQVAAGDWWRYESEAEWLAAGGGYEAKKAS